MSIELPGGLLSKPGLEPADLATVYAIASGAQSRRQIARALNRSPAWVTTSIARLNTAGVIAYRPGYGVVAGEYLILGKHSEAAPISMVGGQPADPPVSPLTSPSNSSDLYDFSLPEDEARPEPEPEKPVKKGTRLAADWQPGESLRRWAEEKWGGDPTPLIENFVDYWIARPGAGGIKLDWDATFRNSVRKQCEWRAGRAARGNTQERAAERRAQIGRAVRGFNDRFGQS